MESDESFDYLFKIVLIGDMGVGKTCVVQRFKNGTYIEKQGTTIGVDFTMKTLVIDGRRIKLQVWDTGGQERFRTITQSYYRSANGIVLCYDVTCRQSFDSLHRWIEDVSKFAVPNVAKILVGTKGDLEEQRTVDHDEGVALSKAHNMINFMEVSSKNNVNVDSVFLELATQLKNCYDNEVQETTSGLSDYKTFRHQLQELMKAPSDSDVPNLYRKPLKHCEALLEIFVDPKHLWMADVNEYREHDALPRETLKFIEFVFQRTALYKSFHALPELTKLCKSQKETIRYHALRVARLICRHYDDVNGRNGLQEMIDDLRSSHEMLKSELQSMLRSQYFVREYCQNEGKLQQHLLILETLAHVECGENVNSEESAFSALCELASINHLLVNRKVMGIRVAFTSYIEVLRLFLDKRQEHIEHALTLIGLVKDSVINKDFIWIIKNHIKNANSHEWKLDVPDALITFIMQVLKTQIGREFLAKTDALAILFHIVAIAMKAPNRFRCGTLALQCIMEMYNGQPTCEVLRTKMFIVGSDVLVRFASKTIVEEVNESQRQIDACARQRRRKPDNNTYTLYIGSAELLKTAFAFLNNLRQRLNEPKRFINALDKEFFLSLSKIIAQSTFYGKAILHSALDQCTYCTSVRGALNTEQVCRLQLTQIMLLRDTDFILDAEILVKVPDLIRAITQTRSGEHLVLRSKVISRMLESIFSFSLPFSGNHDEHLKQIISGLARKIGDLLRCRPSLRNQFMMQLVEIVNKLTDVPNGPPVEKIIYIFQRMLVNALPHFSGEDGGRTLAYFKIDHLLLHFLNNAFYNNASYMLLIPARHLFCQMVRPNMDSFREMTNVVKGLGRLDSLDAQRWFNDVNVQFVIRVHHIVSLFTSVCAEVQIGDRDPRSIIFECFDIATGNIEIIASIFRGIRIYGLALAKLTAKSIQPLGDDSRRRHRATPFVHETFDHLLHLVEVIVSGVIRSTPTMVTVQTMRTVCQEFSMLLSADFDSNLERSVYISNIIPLTKRLLLTGNKINPTMVALLEDNGCVKALKNMAALSC